MNKNTNCTTTSFPRPTQPIASAAHGHSTRLRRKMRIIGQRVQRGGERGGKRGGGLQHGAHVAAHTS
jgi:hypothetical protein